MRINKEGFKILALSACAAVAVCAALFLFTPLWLAIGVTVVCVAFLLFSLYFFREPSRPRIAADDVVFSPADGKIVALEHVFEKEYLKEECIQVSVFMSLTNVHANWFPVGGEVEYVKYHPGKYYMAWNPKASENNERTTVVVRGAGRRILFRQIAGILARRIVCYAREGAEVAQNEKCGFIKFGSRVDLFLPTDAEILVGIGDRVTGSRTPLARLPR